MSRRTIMSLAAAAIFGIGFILTISTEASAYRVGYRGGVYRGGGFYRGVRPGVAVGIGAAAVGAAAVGAAAAGAYYAPGYGYAPGYYGAPAAACPYGYYFYAPYGRCVPTP